MFIIKLLVGLINVKVNLVEKKCLYMLVYREFFMFVLIWLYLFLLVVGKFKNGVYFTKIVNMFYEDEF